MRVPKPNAKI